MKKIVKIIILMFLIISITYAFAYILKYFGINQGWLTRIVPFVSILLNTIVFSRMIDKLSISEIGLRFHIKNLLIICVFICLSSIPALIELIFYGGITFKKTIDINLLSSIFYYFFVAFSEELLYRGYIGKILEDYHNITKATISALAFSSSHFISPEFNFINFILIFIFGIIFMYMYIYIRNLWPLIFFHLSWNVLSNYITSYQNVIVCQASLVLIIFIISILSKRYNVDKI